MSVTPPQQITVIHQPHHPDLTGLNPNVWLEPGIAKRRCHLHPERPESSAALIKQLQGFLWRS